MKKIGVFGGTFDPVHIGHIEKADEALLKLDLDSVLWVVSGEPWMKTGRPISAARHRVEMVKIAISGKADMEVSDIEITRGGPSHTVDTLLQLNKAYPENELTLLVGSDLIKKFDQWKSINTVLSLAKLAIFVRTENEIDLGNVQRLHPDANERISVLRGEIIEVTSSRIRELASRNESISPYVPKGIENYIIENKLY